MTQKPAKKIREKKPLRRKLTERRSFLKQVLLIGAGGLAGLTALGNYFLIRPPEEDSKQVSKKRGGRKKDQVFQVSQQEGFYVNSKKGKLVIYYLYLDARKKTIVSPALKSIAAKKFTSFMNKLKSVTFDEVVKMVEQPDTVLLHPVWTAERVLGSLQNGELVTYRKFIDSIMMQNFLDPHSQMKLADLSAKSVKMELKKTIREDLWKPGKSRNANIKLAMKNFDQKVNAQRLTLLKKYKVLSDNKFTLTSFKASGIKPIK